MVTCLRYSSVVWTNFPLFLREGDAFGSWQSCVPCLPVRWRSTALQDFAGRRLQRVRLAFALGVWTFFSTCPCNLRFPVWCWVLLRRTRNLGYRGDDFLLPYSPRSWFDRHMLCVSLRRRNPWFDSGYILCVSFSGLPEEFPQFLREGSLSDLEADSVLFSRGVEKCAQ